MKEPKTIQDLQSFNSKITSLSRFLSKSVIRSLPFFKALRGHMANIDTSSRNKTQNIEWSEEAGRAYVELKATFKLLLSSLNLYRRGPLPPLCCD